jgi:hypothetical protein
LGLMKCAVAALFLLSAICGFAETPKTAVAMTKYGSFRFNLIQIIRAIPDAPCGFWARVENHTGTTWDDPVFSVKLSGAEPGGVRKSFEVEAHSDYIGNVGGTDEVTGKCMTDRPEISIDRIDISLIAGQPDLEIIQQLEKARTAEKKALKRDADATAVRAAYLAKLPLVSSGTPIAFIASDRKCAEQFQEAATMEGLEKRKRLADLIAYGCGFSVDSPVHADLVQKQGGFALVKLAHGNYAGKSGWVPAAWVR